MAHRLLVVPSGHQVGLTSVCLGMTRALARLGIRYGFVKPIDLDEAEIERSSALIELTTHLSPPAPIARTAAEQMLGQGREAELLERVVAQVEQASSQADVVVVEGLVPLDDVSYATRLNIAMAKALDAELVLVATPGAYHSNGALDPVKVADNVDIAARAYGELPRQCCCVLNMVRPEATSATVSEQTIEALRDALGSERLHPLGIIPYAPELAAPRMKELAVALGARTINEGGWTRRRVERVALCAASVGHAIERLTPGTLVITPGDREDIILGVALAELQGAQLAGLLLTGGRTPSERVLSLCRLAMRAGLVVLQVDDDSYPTATRVHAMPRDVPPDDRERAELVMDYVAGHLDKAWLARLAAGTQQRRMTTPAFRYRLIERARAAQRTIVLPEGDEPRTVRATAICAERGIARPMLLGDRQAIMQVARSQGVTLPDSVAIIEPEQVKARYVAPMVALRRHRGLTEAVAANQLDDTVVLGTMMLQQGEVDGLVSGAVHTTANTIRPALQLIKTAPGATLVSSVFFMCLPEQVLVYGDCAVNPNPSAEQLAEIALQSAASAQAFGIEPRVAMISYSTGTSGAGADVSKVAEATELARQRMPQLLIDGPLQYDAAAISDVGRKKAPDSPVAGRATVFVFPDLNTGNTTYKAVQRSAHVVSMGPMLQGLAKPVNDLSRGALVEDIVFTIALTAIQANALDSDGTGR